MNSIFNQVKDSLDIVEVAKRYGVNVVKNNKAFCPFHNDTKTPNLSFKNNRFKCFSCDKGGDVIDLVKELFNITPLQAVKSLCSDFNLPYDLGTSEETKKAIKKTKEDNAIYESYLLWEKETYIKLCRRGLLIDRYIEKNKSVFSEEIRQATFDRNYINYLLDIFLSKDFNQILSLYKDRDILI